MLAYNVLIGGFGSGFDLDATVDVIRESDADLVGLVEQGIIGPLAADRLGYEVRSFDLDLAVLSRFPITAVHEDGVTVALPPGREVFLFVAHLEPEPYEPYLVRDGALDEVDDVVASARSSRAGETATILGRIAEVVETVPHGFLVGDLNEPSHLDWTADAAAAGLHFGLEVPWPTSLAIEAAGFVDAYRAVRPDPVADPGDTWTPRPGPERGPRPDRLRARPRGGRPGGWRVLGELHPSTDRVIEPWPSDHRAVLATVAVPDP